MARPLVQVRRNDGAWAWFCRRCRRAESARDQPQALTLGRRHHAVHDEFGLRPQGGEPSC